MTADKRIFVYGHEGQRKSSSVDHFEWTRSRGLRVVFKDDPDQSFPSEYTLPELLSGGEGQILEKIGDGWEIANPGKYGRNPPAKMPQAFTYDDARELVASTRRGNLGANTTISQRGDDVVIRLYATDIITYHPDDTITLNSGGYRTRTTMGRLNSFLSPKATIHAKRGKWYITSASGVYPFEDGVTLTAARGGVRENPRRFVKDRHEPMYPRYVMEEWEYDHLLNWLASGRAPISSDRGDDPSEVRRIASRIQSWLQTLDKEDGVYEVERGWPNVFDAYERAKGERL